MQMCYFYMIIIWTMHDLEQCSVCSDEINKGEPSISINDNDDFSNDTLTGGGTAHRCNWMFLQHLKHCNSLSQEIEASWMMYPCIFKMPNLCHNYSVKKHLKCGQ